MSKILTIAVPCYNSEAYTEHCIDSLLKAGEDVEILIVDDGSTDGTAAIADRYEAEYPEIVRAIHKENGGHGSAVNTGLQEASGLYYKVVDSDDFLKEQKSRSSDLEAKFAAAKEAQKNRAELLEKKFEAAKQNKDLKDPPPSINWD